mmetsp:Transcript_4733/g.19443  ORF Transcript_4733/g.19443 Transcript_4733/m.19443 type:complete len:294 (+) Transcript_4733:741-1622(+)
MHPRGLHARLHEVHRLAGRRLGSRVGHPRQLAPAKRPTDGRAGFLQGDLLARRFRQPRVRQEAHQDARRVQAAPQPLRQPHLHRHRQQPAEHVRAVLLGVRASAPGGRLQPTMRDVRAGQGGETRSDAPVRRVRGLAPRRVRRLRPDRLGNRPRRRRDCHLLRVRQMPRRREEGPEEAHHLRVRARDARGPGGPHEAQSGGKLRQAPRHAAPAGPAVRSRFRSTHPRPRRVGTSYREQVRRQAHRNVGGGEELRAPEEGRGGTTTEPVGRRVGPRHRGGSRRLWRRFRRRRGD